MEKVRVRDLIDLLDYERTGVRRVRIVNDDTEHTDILTTDSRLIEYIENVPVNTIDTVGGMLTMYINGNMIGVQK